MQSPGSDVQLSKPLIQVLSKWGQLGRGFSPVTSSGGASTWQGIADISQELLVADEKRFRKLLDESHRRLKPFGDPLFLSFGTHRWLKEEREESYSDWLAWIVENLPSHRHVFLLFDIPLPGKRKAERWEAPEVRREKSIEGVESGRRLDIDICYSTKARIVVEIKIVDAEDADTGKQREYFKWLEEQPEPWDRKWAVMVANSGIRSEYENFRFQTWGNLCARLRRLVQSKDLSDNNLLVAMVLAFVGAVEQNILGIPGPDLPDFAKASVNWSDSANHLENSLREEADHET